MAKLVHLLWVHIKLYAHTNIPTYVRMYIYLLTQSMHVCTCTYTYVHVYVRMYVCTCTITNLVYTDLRMLAHRQQQTVCTYTYLCLLHHRCILLYVRTYIICTQYLLVGKCILQEVVQLAHSVFSLRLPLCTNSHHVNRECFVNRHSDLCQVGMPTGE